MTSRRTYRGRDVQIDGRSLILPVSSVIYFGGEQDVEMSVLT